MDFERHEGRPNVLRMRPAVDSFGKTLRREGPCYICGGRTSYRFCSMYARYGDAWLERKFASDMRAENVQRIRYGTFRTERGGGGNVLLRQLMKFVCKECIDDLENRQWPDYVDFQRAMLDRFGCSWWSYQEAYQRDMVARSGPLWWVRSNTPVSGGGSLT